jgi:hypothetical protein
VLVIDDDPAMLHSLASAFEAYGIGIATARDGLSGLAAFLDGSDRVRDAEAHDFAHDNAVLEDKRSNRPRLRRNAKTLHQGWRAVPRASRRSRALAM